MKSYNLRWLFLLVAVAALASWYGKLLLQCERYEGLASDIGIGESWQRYGDLESDKHIAIKIDSSLSRAQPKWEHTDANPPVSARRALQIGDQFRRERFQDHAFYNWSLEHVALTPLDVKEDKWCWIVLFSAVPKPGIGGSGIWPQFPVYVLMDGTTIEPEDPDNFLKPKQTKL